MVRFHILKMNTLKLYENKTSYISGNPSFAIKTVSDGSVIASENTLFIQAPNIKLTATESDCGSSGVSLLEILDNVAVGPAGPCGPQGLQGTRGATGCAGPVGPSGVGVQGPVGPQGPAGEKGCEGGTGSVGPRGLRGCVGDAGCPGATGQKGEMGCQGPMGPIGPQGPCGTKGSCGECNQCCLEVTSEPVCGKLTNVNGKLFWDLGKVSTGEDLPDNKSVFSGQPQLPNVEALYNAGGLAPWSFFPDSYCVINGKWYTDIHQLQLNILQAIGELNAQVNP